MKNIFFKLIGVAIIMASLSAGARAQMFDDGIPLGWTCRGSCGTSASDGVITTAPAGGAQYGWVSSHDGYANVLLPGVPGYDGSRLSSTLFTAAAGQSLAFQFNYITSDGPKPDNAWAGLLDQNDHQIAILFTARTTTSGATVPGFDMPAVSATLTPTSAPIILSNPVWSPLHSGTPNCYSVLTCGYTGWVGSSYTISEAGTYRLEFGVTNVRDGEFDSGLAIDGAIIGASPITAVPEPEAYTMMIAGIGMLYLIVRHRRYKPIPSDVNDDTRGSHGMARPQVCYSKQGENFRWRPWRAEPCGEAYFCFDQAHDAAFKFDLRESQCRYLGRAHTGFDRDANDPAQHRIGVFINGSQQAQLFAGTQATIASWPRRRTAQIQHRIVRNAKLPFLHRNGEEVANQG